MSHAGGLVQHVVVVCYFTFRSGCTDTYPKVPSHADLRTPRPPMLALIQRYRCIRLFIQLLSTQRGTGGGDHDNTGGERNRASSNSGSSNSDSSTNGGKRWVLKTPQHSAQIPAIKAVFPDAVVVLTSRNPTSVLRSLLPLLSYSLGVQNDRLHLHDFGADWTSRFVYFCLVLVVVALSFSNWRYLVCLWLQLGIFLGSPCVDMPTPCS
jgi:hypothetical protein